MPPVEAAAFIISQESTMFARISCVSVVVVMLSGCGGGDPVNHNGTPPADQSNAAGNGDEKVQSEFQMGIQSEPYGQTADGDEITQYFLTNKHGLTVSIINYGAIVTSVVVPDRDGHVENIVLGFDDLQGYLGNAPYFGAICGRFSNRIRDGKFTLNGQEYTLATNNDPNHLHGGLKGFDKVVWLAEPVPEAVAADGQAALKLTYVSEDGEEGYPGRLEVHVIYSLTDNNELKIDYTATSTKPTPVNLTNHCYWNLTGAAERDILEHSLTLHCDKFLPVDDTLIPTGELKDVQGTPMDFTSGQTIGSRIGEVGIGYDHCYVVRASDNQPAPVAKVVDPNSGRVMTITSTEPGVQFYSGNFLDGTAATGGYAKHDGFCLECQHFPDSPNQPDFPTAILNPGQVYRQTTIHHFSVE